MCECACFSFCGFNSGIQAGKGSTTGLVTRPECASLYRAHVSLSSLHIHLNKSISTKGARAVVFPVFPELRTHSLWHTAAPGRWSDTWAWGLGTERSVSRKNSGRHSQKHTACTPSQPGAAVTGRWAFISLGSCYQVCALSVPTGGGLCGIPAGELERQGPH